MFVLINVGGKIGKLLYVDGINDAAVATEGLPPHDDVHGCGRVERVPENILLSVRARCLVRKACDLPTVPSYPTTTAIYDTKT